jgi:hypothetical protein
VTDNLRREKERLAIEACCQTRNDAVRLLGRINEGGDTYFDRPEVGVDVDVTQEHVAFFEAVIDRMDIALAAFEAHEAKS